MLFALQPLSCPGDPPVRDLCNRNDMEPQSRGHEQVDSAKYLPKRILDKMARNKERQEKVDRAWDKLRASIGELEERTRYLDPNPELEKLFLTGGDSISSPGCSSSTAMDPHTDEQMDSANDKLAIYMPKRVRDKMERNEKIREEVDRLCDKFEASVEELMQRTK